MAVAVHEDEAELTALLEKISAERSFDARPYKPNFFRRRLAIRLRACGAGSHCAYIDVLDGDAGEFERLMSALIINLTYFFRDGGAFGALRERVLAPLVRERGHAAHPRLHIWCAGCATGEDALALARDGRYGEFRLRHMAAGLCECYFVPTQEGNRIVPEIARLVRFQRHDPLHNAYLRRLDLIPCRNVLIYPTRSLHVELFQRFHEALRARGSLLLGRVAIPPRAARVWFEPLDVHEHLYARL